MPCAISPLKIFHPWSQDYVVARPMRRPRKGLDFFAISHDTNQPSTSIRAEVRPVFSGVVEFILNEDPSRSPAGTPSMPGYGNAVVVRHNAEFDNVSLPGLPPVFWTIYANLASVDRNLRRGDAVDALRVLGAPGATSNGRFRLNPPRVHFEIRSAMPPGDLRRDSIDPVAILAAGGVQVGPGGLVSYVNGPDNGDPRCSQAARSIRS
jgi:murein DD-endopeptidase MepM/ murein hydrolase activator NlpD